MSKPWKPGRETVALQPSRIRRAPPPAPLQKEIRLRSSEQEVWFGMTGVVLTAAALAVLTIAVALLTVFRAADVKSGDFPQCYSGGGGNCVLDGDTVYVNRERIEIAGMAAPRIQGAGCPAERERGIAAAIALSDILGSGEVRVGPPVRDPGGIGARPVQVAGTDVAGRMIAAGHARRAEGQRPQWSGCSQ